jgi:hypothetical protein
MITFREHLFNGWHKGQLITRNGDDCGIGNILFFTAGTIGVATKNGYSYGLPKWVGSDYFVNPIPEPERREYKEIDLPWGFSGFDIPDNSSIFGWMQTEKYFKHCEELIRHYFTLKPICEPIKDAIIVHYRAYKNVEQMLVPLKNDYYRNALAQLPNKRIVVVTDNIAQAREVVGVDGEYRSGSPIEDFYIVANADYLVMSNSSFSWWGAWLSKAMTVCPKTWIPPTWGDVPGIPNSQDDIFCKEWIMV